MLGRYSFTAPPRDSDLADPHPGVLVGEQARMSRNTRRPWLSNWWPLTRSMAIRTRFSETNGTVGYQNRLNACS